VRDAQTEVELLAEQPAVVAGQTLTLGVRLRPDAGWHIYWRNPGGSGTAPRLTWDLPEGFEAGDIQWPYPKRHPAFGVTNYGYEREVLLLVDVAVPEEVPAGPIRLAVRADWLACEKVCILGSADLAVELPVIAMDEAPVAGEEAGGVAGEVDPAVAARFARARSELPADAGGAVTASRAGNRPIVRFTAPGAEPVDDAYFFIADSGIVAYGDAQPLRAAESASSAYTLELPLARRNLPVGELPDRLRGVLSYEQDGQWHHRAVDTPLVATTATSADGGLLWHLGLALLGGMILNLMPCVFPVLSLKVLGFVQHSHGNPWTARAHGLTYALGVLVSFWVLAILLIGLRAAGTEAGWGFHLQSPIFIALMAMLIVAIGLNLAGVFDIGIGLMNAAGRAATQGPASSTGYAGSLGTGILATILATPCTAPFMGIALGYALIQPPTTIVLVLSSLGVGMAAPYVLLAWFPALTRRLPRPGAWMESFKQFLAFPMFAVAAWLVWVFGNQVASSETTLVLLLALLVVGFAAWVYGRWGMAGGGRALGRTVAVALLAMAVASPLMALKQEAAVDAMTWEPFSDERVEELRRDEGRMVFVDFTADWCLSCKWFERTVLASASVREAFTEHDVALVKADWTNEDEHITRALARFERRSVPFYVLYPADPAAEPIELGEFITRGSVREAVVAADGGPRLADER
ncbi:MAG: protein-disulfide reductase DsbD domain-containing protein, partial [Phycisphaeraceae bacterium]